MNVWCRRRRDERSWRALKSSPVERVWCPHALLPLAPLFSAAKPSLDLALDLPRQALPLQNGACAFALFDLAGAMQLPGALASDDDVRHVLRWLGGLVILRGGDVERD